MMQNNNDPVSVELVVKNAATLSPALVDDLASQKMLTEEHILDSVNRRLEQNQVPPEQRALSCYCVPFDGSKSLSSFKAVVNFTSNLRGFASIFLNDLNVNRVLFSAEEIMTKPIKKVEFARPIQKVEIRRPQNTYTIELKSKTVHAGNMSKLQALTPGDILQRVNDFLRPNIHPYQLALQCERDFKENAAVLVFPSELERESALALLSMLYLNGAECEPIIHNDGDIRSSSSGYVSGINRDRDSGSVFDGYARDNVVGGNNMGGGGRNVGGNVGIGKEVVVDAQNTLILKCTSITHEAMRKNYKNDQLLAAVKTIMRRYMSDDDVSTILINHTDIQRVGDWVKLTFPSNDHCSVAEGFLNNCELLTGIVVIAEQVSTSAPLLGSRGHGAAAAATAAATVDTRKKTPHPTYAAQHSDPVYPQPDNRLRDNYQKSDFNNTSSIATGPPRRGESPTYGGDVAGGARTVNYRGRQIYMFWDMSNILFKMGLSGNPRKVMETVACGGQNFQYKYACGSMPGKFSQTESKWMVDEPEWQSFLQSEKAEQVTGPANSWKIDVQVRLKGVGEFNVDEGLCAHVYKNVLDNISKNGVIIILSGDGANDRGCVSIQQTIEHIISLDIFANWTVHLWTWKESCHRRYMDYADLQKSPELKERFHLSFFNDYPAVFGVRGGSNSRPVHRENPSHASNRHASPFHRENPSHASHRHASPVHRENPSHASHRHASPVHRENPSHTSRNDRGPSPETKYSESSNRNLYEVIEDNIYQGNGVLQLNKGSIVSIDQYEFDDNWSIVVDSNGQRGYCRTVHLRPMLK